MEIALGIIVLVFIIFELYNSRQIKGLEDKIATLSVLEELQGKYNEVNEKEWKQADRELDSRITRMFKSIKALASHLNLKIQERDVAGMNGETEFRVIPVCPSAGDEQWREDQKQRIEDMLLRRRLSSLKDEVDGIKEVLKVAPSQSAVDQIEQIIKREIDGYKRQVMRTREDVSDMTNVIGMILDYLKVDVVKTPETTELKKATKKAKVGRA